MRYLRGVDLPGWVMDDWWIHHGVSVLEVRYLRGVWIYLGG